MLCFERLGPFSFRSLGSLNGMDSDHGDDGDGIDTKSRAAHHGQRRSGGRRLRRLIWWHRSFKKGMVKYSQKWWILELENDFVFYVLLYNVKIYQDIAVTWLHKRRHSPISHIYNTLNTGLINPLLPMTQKVQKVFNTFEVYQSADI